MYTSTLGATPLCMTEAQRAEAARLCGCMTGSSVLHGLGAGDAYTVIDVSTGVSTTKPKCVTTMTMPADFDPRNPCEGAARALCPPRLGRPVTPSSSTSPPSSSDPEYEDEVVQSAMLKQQIMVFGLLGIVVAAGGYAAYRALKKKG